MKMNSILSRLLSNYVTQPLTQIIFQNFCSLKVIEIAPKSLFELLNLKMYVKSYLDE